MWKVIIAGAAIGALMFGPVGVLLAVAVLMSPAAQSECLPGGSLTVGQVPDSLTATTTDGVRVTLNKTQLTHAATIITVGGQTSGVGVQGVTVALMAALTESSLRMLANTSSYPDSANYPNDGNGSDHDSLGLFQMRPHAGWGTVAELMDPAYQARAFFGGSSGPNHGSPRGLLDIRGWQQMTDGEAAQSVEVSAYPDRYARYQPVATAIIAALSATASSAALDPSAAPSVPATTQIVFPLPAGTWTVSSPFGPRDDPITGVPEFHHGVDLAAKAGTPVLAAAAGRIVVAGMVDGTGTITILTTVNGATVAFTYLHMYQSGIGVTVGEEVSAGEKIGAVGSSGHSTGPHLFFEVQLGGQNGTAVDPMPWLSSLGSTTLTGPSSEGCSATS